MQLTNKVRNCFFLKASWKRTSIEGIYINMTLLADSSKICLKIGPAILLRRLYPTDTFSHLHKTHTKSNTTFLSSKNIMAIN